MKQLAIVIIMSILAVPVFSQELFESLTEKYAELDGFSASNISNDMFEMYLKKKDIDKDSPVYATLENLDNILLVSFRDFENREEEPTIEGLHSELLNHYKNLDYSLFKTEKQMGEDVKVYLKKNQEDINALALITSSEMSVHLVELIGLIDMKTLSELGSVMNLRGLENLYRINNSTRKRYFSGNYDFNFSWENFNDLNEAQMEKLEKAFTNQKWFSEEKLQEFQNKAQEMVEDHEFFNQEKIRQMEMKARELAEQQHMLSEEQIKKIEQQAREMAERGIKMEEKYREMAEKYKREPIFIAAPGDTNTVYYLDGKKVNAKKMEEINKGAIETIEIKKGKKEGDKTVIRIKTK